MQEIVLKEASIYNNEYMHAFPLPTLFQLFYPPLPSLFPPHPTPLNRCFCPVALPLDTTKTVIQGTDRKAGVSVPGVIATMSRLVREGGIGRLYFGWPAALGRGVPGAAIIFVTHAQVSRALEGSSLAVMSAVDTPESATAAAALSTPAGVIKK